MFVLLLFNEFNEGVLENNYNWKITYSKKSRIGKKLFFAFCNRYKLEHGKFYLSTRRNFCCESGTAVAQAARRYCDVSFSADFQNSPRRDLRQPALSDPALPEELDWMVLRGPFQPPPDSDSVIMWHLTSFCDCNFKKKKWTCWLWWCQLMIMQPLRF